uniref:Uncharacterized protein n=1 Tax=Cyclophora tenuis TaxID=216820 RepID=A0A7S1CZ30_CYCTE
MVVPREKSIKSHHQRWLQQMVDVAIYPSIAMTASVMPSFWEKKEHILSVEMTNYRNEKVTVNSLSLVSREYRLEDMNGQMEDGSSSIELEFQERVTKHYRLLPDGDVGTVACSSGNFDGSGSACVFEPAESNGDVVDFLCLESAYLRFQSALKMYQIEASRSDDEESQPRHVSQIRRAKTADSTMEDDKEDPMANTHPTSIARMCPLNDRKTLIDLVCRWSSTNNNSSGDGQKDGQTHNTQLGVRSRETSRGCPITITCQYPSSVTHNFANGPAHVPFEVTARNRLVEAGVEFDFAVERPKTFEFMGADSFHWTLENGGDEVTIPMHAVIPSTGVFNLQQIRITVQRPDKKVPYLFPLQWLVTVQDQ